MGIVVLEVTITSDGRAVNISLMKDPGMGLGEKAVEAVRTWKFVLRQDRRQDRGRAGTN